MEKKTIIDDISGKSINFLIGSGASSGVVPTLWIESISKSFEDILSSNDYSENQKNVLYYLWFILWIRETMVKEETAKNKDVLNNYNVFVRSLVRLINNEGYDRQKRVNIFTTNYDTFFELSFDNYSEKNRLAYFNDGSRGFLKKYISTEDFYLSISHSGMSDSFRRSVPILNLIKLHGSVTWIKDNDKIKVDIHNEVFNSLVEKSNEINDLVVQLDNENEDLANSFAIEEIEKYLNAADFTEENLLEGVDRLNDLFELKFSDFKKLYDELPIVSPTSRKFEETVFDQHYYQMLRLLSFELEKKNTVLIVFGFSFADKHILEIVRRSMVNPTLKIFIVSYNKESQEQVKDLLGSDIRLELLPSFENIDPGESIQGNFDYFNSLFNSRRS